MDIVEVTADIGAKDSAQAFYAAGIRTDALIIVSFINKYKPTKHEKFNRKVIASTKPSFKILTPNYQLQRVQFHFLDCIFLLLPLTVNLRDHLNIV